jgi:putative endonuclease
MAFVYVLKSANFPKSYTGSTNDLGRRLREHVTKPSAYVKQFGPWELFYKEEYATLAEARTREQYLKTAAGRRYLKIFENNNIPR